MGFVYTRAISMATNEPDFQMQRPYHLMKNVRFSFEFQRMLHYICIFQNVVDISACKHKIDEAIEREKNLTKRHSCRSEENIICKKIIRINI